jgi:hypothetical protein
MAGSTLAVTDFAAVAPLLASEFPSTFAALLDTHSVVSLQ